MKSNIFPQHAVYLNLYLVFEVKGERLSIFCVRHISFLRPFFCLALLKNKNMPLPVSCRVWQSKYLLHHTDTKLLKKYNIVIKKKRYLFAKLPRHPVIVRSFTFWCRILLRFIYLSDTIIKCLLMVGKC